MKFPWPESFWVVAHDSRIVSDWFHDQQSAIDAAADLGVENLGATYYVLSAAVSVTHVVRVTRN